MECSVYTSVSMLVVVRHPKDGHTENGKAICNEVISKLARCRGPVCVFHDATRMEAANPGYAGAFKELDRELSERTTEVVCVVPRLVPRIMALTVAKLSSRKWTIFTTITEAFLYLSKMGFDLPKDVNPDCEWVYIKHAA